MLWQIRQNLTFQAAACNCSLAVNMASRVFSLIIATNRIAALVLTKEITGGTGELHFQLRPPPLISIGNFQKNDIHLTMMTPVTWHILKALDVGVCIVSDPQSYIASELYKRFGVIFSITHITIHSPSAMSTAACMYTYMNNPCNIRLTLVPLAIKMMAPEST